MLGKKSVPKYDASTEELFMLGDYRIVHWPKMGFMTHLSISRKDGMPTHNWWDLMHIKNEVLGEEVEACELYPANSRLVDEENVYHLFALPEGMSFPFGMK